MQPIHNSLLSIAGRLFPLDLFIRTEPCVVYRACVLDKPLPTIDAH